MIEATNNQGLWIEGEAAWVDAFLNVARVLRSRRYDGIQAVM